MPQISAGPVPQRAGVPPPLRPKNRRQKPPRQRRHPAVALAVAIDLRTVSALFLEPHGHLVSNPPIRPLP